MINHKDNLSINFSGIKALPTFRTKKEAVSAGGEYGWRDAVRVVDRFENVWVVGLKMFGDDTIAGVKRAHYRFPLLKWEKKNGVEFCPVLHVYKVL